MEYGHELYAERLRLKAQAAALANGAAQWTDQLDMAVRIKIGLAWDVFNRETDYELANVTNSLIEERSTRSMAVTLSPGLMANPAKSPPNANLLSLVEAEHEVLIELAERVRQNTYGGGPNKYDTSAENFRQEVNRVFAAHLVGLHLHHNSRLVPIDSHEMHNAVVAPTLYLLHSQPKFAGAEAAYQKALKELRNHDAGDAITDAATALQEVLLALGCVGGALGDLVSSAKKNGLLTGTDTPLTESIIKTVNWVAAKRNQGEAHRGDPEIDLSDAWMVVHVVGTLAIRLSESGGLKPT